MTDITVSAPYYGYEAWLPWSRYRDATLTELSQAAVYQLNADVVPPTFVSRMMTPALTLRIPGREIPSMDIRVSQILAPGDLVLLLTSSELRGFEGISTRDSLVPPLLRESTPSYVTQALLQALTQRTSGITGGARPRRYDHLLADHRDQQHQEIEPDEEIMTGTDQVTQVIQTLDLISRMMGTRRTNFELPTAAPVMTSEVKKVLNMETFLRVCPIVAANPESPDADLGSCSVCLELMKPPDELRKMPSCVHIFHSTCLSQWLTNNAITCPVCREPAVTDKKDYGYLGYGTRPDVYVPAISTEAQEDSEPELPSWVPVFPYTGGTVARRRE